MINVKYVPYLKTSISFPSYDKYEVLFLPMMKLHYIFLAMINVKYIPYL